MDEGVNFLSGLRQDGLVSSFNVKTAHFSKHPQPAALFSFIHTLRM